MNSHGVSNAHKNDAGAALVITDKNDQFSLLKNTLSGLFSDMIQVRSLGEAVMKTANRQVGAVFAFMPFTDGKSIDDAAGFAEKRFVPLCVFVGTELYPETAYRMKGRYAFVLSYPIQAGMLIQTANILISSRIYVSRLSAERDSLQDKLTDMSVINRAKLLLVEKRRYTEEQAHHALEKAAMDRGISKRKAAEAVLHALGSD